MGDAIILLARSCTRYSNYSLSHLIWSGVTINPISHWPEDSWTFLDFVLCVKIGVEVSTWIMVKIILQSKISIADDQIN